jgi:hypothetical protein
MGPAGGSKEPATFSFRRFMEWYHWLWWALACISALFWIIIGICWVIVIKERPEENADYWRKKYERLDTEFKKLDKEMVSLVKMRCQNKLGEYYP